MREVVPLRACEMLSAMRGRFREPPMLRPRRFEPEILLRARNFSPSEFRRFDSLLVASDGVVENDSVYKDTQKILGKSKGLSFITHVPTSKYQVKHTEHI